MSERELHIFADASSLTYGKVTCYRIISNFDIKVSFIIAKSRLAPLKEKSLAIPKLELQAALIASRLKVKILDEKELNIKGIYLWTDSKNILKYILNENKRFPVYLIPQISEIRTNSKDLHFIS